MALAYVNIPLKGGDDDNNDKMMLRKSETTAPSSSQKGTNMMLTEEMDTMLEASRNIEQLDREAHAQHTRARNVHFDDAQ